MAVGDELDDSEPLTVEKKCTRKALNSSRFPSPIGTSTGSNGTDTTGKSSRTSSSTVMPHSSSTKNHTLSINCNCTDDDCNHVHGKDGPVPQVILLGSDLLHNTHKQSKDIHLLNVDGAIASGSKLDESHLSTDTSITSVTSSNNHPEAEESTESVPNQDEPVIAKATKQFSHFNLFRIQYLIVHTAIMLADGLQGELARNNKKTFQI